jgi:hypothetical protein
MRNKHPRPRARWSSLEIDRYSTSRQSAAKPSALSIEELVQAPSKLALRWITGRPQRARSPGGGPLGPIEEPDREGRWAATSRTPLYTSIGVTYAHMQAFCSHGTPWVFGEKGLLSRALGSWSLLGSYERPRASALSSWDSQGAGRQAFFKMSGGSSKGPLGTPWLAHNGCIQAMFARGLTSSF